MQRLGPVNYCRMSPFTPYQRGAVKSYLTSMKSQS